jgi:glycosyltransferase involved in cell wall biosynthesis
LNTIRALVGESADAVIANSQGGADYWRHVVRRRGDVRVIGNAVPVDRITSAQSVGTSEGIAVDEAVILYVGRFSAEKNLQTLLRALARVLRRPATRAVFCGDGPLRDEIERLATDLGIRDRTAFLGSVSNVWSWMKRADVLVTVSRFEGNPNVVLEAAAAGLPIVASEIPAHRAVLLQDTARFVDANSSEHIAVAIEAVLSQPEEARGRATKARRLVERRSEVEVAAEYETAYRAVLERAGKPEVA